MLPVTYLIPVYGRPIFWKDCLESLKEEPCEEVVIVGNGIDQKYADQIRTYIQTDSRFRYHELLEANLVHALNYGIHLSKNEHIARLDIDDLVITGRTALQYNYFLQNPGLALLGGQVIHIGDGKLSGKQSHYPTFRTGLDLAMSRYCAIAHPTVMFRKTAVNAVGNYRPEFKHAEDYDLWLRLFEKFRIDNLTSSLTYYRDHDDQISIKNETEQNFSTLAAKLCHKKRIKKQRDLPLTKGNLKYLNTIRILKKYSTFKAIKRKRFRLVYIGISALLSPVDFFIASKILLNRIKALMSEIL